MEDQNSVTYTIDGKTYTFTKIPTEAQGITKQSRPTQRGVKRKASSSLNSPLRVDSQNLQLVSTPISSNIADEVTVQSAVPNGANIIGEDLNTTVSENSDRTYVEIITSPQESAAETSKKQKRGNKSSYKGYDNLKQIKTMEDLLNTEELLKVDSRLCPRRTRTSTQPPLSVSGKQVADWVGPPEGMTYVSLLENLRMCHRPGPADDAKRIFDMIRKATPVDKSMALLSYFTKLQPADVRGLASSMKQASVLTVPSSLKVDIPGETVEKRNLCVNQTIFVMDSIVRSLKATDFNKVTHDGMSLIQASWEIMKMVLLNCAQE